MRPKIFIGSSIEGLPVAYSIQENLEHDPVEVTVWTQGFFHLSQSTLAELIKGLTTYHMGVFVLTPDDVTIIRSEEYKTARDNVIFELGLFFGALGQERAYYVLPRSEKSFRLPTDLLGVNAGTYDDKRQDQNLNAALGSFTNQIRKAYTKIEFSTSQISHFDSVKSFQNLSSPKSTKGETHEFFRFYNDYFLSVYADFVAFTQTKPSQVLIEESNMLSHIVMATSVPKSYDENMKKALDHLIRSTLDLKKLLWVKVKELVDIHMTEGKPGLNPFKKIKTKEKDRNFMAEYLKAFDIIKEARKLETSILEIEPIKIIDMYDQATQIYFSLLKNYELL